MREPLLDARHCGGSLVAIDGDAHQLGAGRCKGCHLARGRLHIGCIRVGHRLHDNRGAAANNDAANINPHGSVTFRQSHSRLLRHRKLPTQYSTAGVPQRYIYSCRIRMS